MPCTSRRLKVSLRPRTKIHTTHRQFFCESVPKPKPWADCCSITNARFANKLAAPALRLCQAQTATGLFAPSKLAVVQWGLHICTWRSGGLGLAPMQCWEQAQCGRMPTGWASNPGHTMLRAREHCLPHCPNPLEVYL